MNSPTSSSNLLGANCREHASLALVSIPDQQSQISSNTREGSEAVEAAMKLARQYFLEKDPGAPRSHFIARQSSWHGCTMGALAVGDLKARKEPFLDVLATNVSHVSPCHPYRDLEDGETEEQYVIRLAQELDDEFQRIGPENVCAFILEPMVGTVSNFLCTLSDDSKEKVLTCSRL